MNFCETSMKPSFEDKVVERWVILGHVGYCVTIYREIRDVCSKTLVDLCNK